MKSRHRAREVALQILYRYDVASSSAGQSTTGNTTPNPAGDGPSHAPGALAQELSQHFDHFPMVSSLMKCGSLRIFLG